MRAARYEPSIPIAKRAEHPSADQFTNYWAWRFADALEALATSTPVGFRQAIAVVHEALVAGDRRELAEAWRTFVTRNIGENTPRSGSQRMDHPEGRRGRPGTGEGRFGLAEPARPFRRAVCSEPWGLPPAADVLVPPGWVTEPAGRCDGAEADIVYDPRRHEVMVSPPTDQDRTAALEAAGWRTTSANGNRVLWTRESSAATRAALGRSGSDVTNNPPERDGPVQATKALDPTAGRHDGYEPGQRVRWKQRGRRWRYGHLADPPVERDGTSLRVFEEVSGSARTLRPGGIERQVRGPRGGRRWVACAPTDQTPPAPRPSGTSARPERRAGPPNGQVRGRGGLGR